MLLGGQFQPGRDGQVAPSELCVWWGAVVVVCLVLGGRPCVAACVSACVYILLQVCYVFGSVYHAYLSVCLPALRMKVTVIK